MLRLLLRCARLSTGFDLELGMVAVISQRQAPMIHATEHPRELSCALRCFTTDSVPERRRDPEFVYRMHQNAEVVAEHLTENFVGLRDRRLRPNRRAKLPLQHREGRFHVRPLVIVRQKFVPLEMVEVPHLRPDFRALWFVVRFEGNERHRADFLNHAEIHVADVSLVSGDLGDIEVFRCSSHQCGEYGQSLASPSLTDTLLMMFVLTPVMTWALRHVRPVRFLPCFSSNQRTNVEVENPELSTAKSVSTAFSGLALSSIIFRRTGVNLASPR